MALLLAGFTMWCCCVRYRRGEEVVIAGKNASEKTWANVPGTCQHPNSMMWHPGRTLSRADTCPCDDVAAVKKQLVYTSVWSVKPQEIPQTPVVGGPQGGITDSGFKRLEEGEGEQSSDLSTSLPKRVLTFDFDDYVGEGEGKAKVGEGEKLEDVPLSELQTEVFPFKALQTATRQFCKEAVLGEGSFGKIYKVTIGKGWEHTL